MIEIVKGHDTSSYFWIMPAKVVDFNKPTNELKNVDECKICEISIEEDIIETYLYYFFKKYFDETLLSNKYREGCKGFERYLEHNFFTFESMKEIIEDIKCLVNQIENDYDSIDKEILQRFTGSWYYVVDYDCWKENDIIKANIVKDNKDIIIEFYNRFIKYIENMIDEGKKNGYDLISVMGP